MSETAAEAPGLAAAGRPRAVPVAAPGSQTRVDVFVADSHWMPYGTVNGVRFSPLSAGLMGSVTYYFDQNVGIEFRGNTQISTLSEGSTGMALGPVYRFATRFRPAIHGNAGGQRFVGPVIPTYAGTAYYGNAPVWAITASIGASAELSIPKTNGHLALRLEASYEYFHCTYGIVTVPFNGGQVNVNSYNINPGLVLRFGHARSSVYRRPPY